MQSVCDLVWMLMDICGRYLFNYKMVSPIWTSCKVIIIFSCIDQTVTIFIVHSYMRFYQKLLISSGAETRTETNCMLCVNFMNLCIRTGCVMNCAIGSASCGTCYLHSHREETLSDCRYIGTNYSCPLLLFLEDQWWLKCGADYKIILFS